MKLQAFLLILLVSFSSWAQDYKITRFEASDFRDFSQEELIQLVGEASHELPHFACDGVKEFNPFQEASRKNPKGDSLKMQGSPDGEVYTYRFGEIFNEKGQSVKRGLDSFVKEALKALRTFERLPSGNKLLRELEVSYFPLTITKGRNSFNPQLEGERSYSGIKMAQAISYFLSKRMSPGGFFKDIGVGGKIQWSPGLKVKTIESDGVTRELDPRIALAHEMYHAFDSIRGLLDMGFVSGEKYEFQNLGEYRGVYFENLIRKEMGIKFRKFYGSPGDLTEADILDDNGQPLSLAAPCLN